MENLVKAYSDYYRLGIEIGALVVLFLAWKLYLKSTSKLDSGTYRVVAPKKLIHRFWDKQFLVISMGLFILSIIQFWVNDSVLAIMCSRAFLIGAMMFGFARKAVFEYTVAPNAAFTELFEMDEPDFDGSSAYITVLRLTEYPWALHFLMFVTLAEIGLILYTAFVP